VNRNFQLKAKALSKGDADDDFIKEISNWLYSFTNYIESEAEEKDSMKKLKAIIRFEQSQSNVSPGLLEFVSEFVSTKFEHKLPFICHCHFMGRYYGNVADNCFTESANSLVARDEMGPKPKYNLANSLGSLLNHTDQQFKKLKSNAYK